jgi:uroporphyrinogen decarboxylase
MNSLERVLAMLAGKTADRRAVAPVLSLYGGQFIDGPLRDYYTDPAAYARGQAAVYETFQPDILFGPFSFAPLAGAFGSQIKYYDNQAPNVRRPAIESVAQWEQVVFPDLESHPGLRFFREAIQLVAEKHRGQVPVAAVLPPPTDIPMLIMGLENWLAAVLFEPERARLVMDQIVPFFVRLANQMFDAGAAFLAVPGGLFSPAVVTRQIVTDFSRPVLEAAFAQLRGPAVFHHAGAPVLAHLDLLLGLPSVIAYAMDRRDNLGETRRLIGPTMAMFAGPVGPNLARQTPAEIAAECREILTERRHDPHFALNTCGADIPLETPAENIHALRQAAEAFGECAW